MADFCGLKRLVVRPEGAYHCNPDAGLVWLPGPKRPTEVRQSRESLSNGPMGVCRSAPALSERAIGAPDA
jgi:hypothetical protein